MDDTIERPVRRTASTAFAAWSDEASMDWVSRSPAELLDLYSQAQRAHLSKDSAVLVVLSDGTVVSGRTQSLFLHRDFM